MLTLMDVARLSSVSCAPAFPHLAGTRLQLYSIRHFGKACLNYNAVAGQTNAKRARAPSVLKDSIYQAIPCVAAPKASCCVVM